MESEEKIKDIIKKSGHDLHLEVADLLRSQSWNVKVSPYYNDPSTNKPREIDILAHKKYEVSYRTGRDAESFTLKLFVECKHIPSEHVLWFVGKDMESATALAKNNPILCNLADSDLRDTSTIPVKVHHYLQRGDVMKLVSKTGKTDPFYDGMSSCLHATIGNPGHQPPDASNVITLQVIVVDSFKKLYRRNRSNGREYESVVDSFQMEVNYSFLDIQGKSTSRYFLVDVVAREGLPSFLDLLERNDVQIIKSNLAFQARRNRFERERNGEMFDPNEVI